MSVAPGRLLEKIPGRLIGLSKKRRGSRAFGAVLQTRELHFTVGLRTVPRLSWFIRTSSGALCHNTQGGRWRGLVPIGVQGGGICSPFDDDSQPRPWETFFKMSGHGITRYRDHSGSAGLNRPPMSDLHPPPLEITVRTKERQCSHAF